MAKLTQQELERHLWGAADILRGTVDAGDYGLRLASQAKGIGGLLPLPM